MKENKLKTSEYNFINLSTEPSNITYYWEDGGTDTKKNFDRNKKRLDADWIYSKKSISYVTNKLGFRNKPFNEVNWANSIVILGCSHVKGTGHAIEDTIPYRLEKILNIPVVNLGISGSAIDLGCWNSLILYDHYPRPKAVVQWRTGLDRYTDRNSTDIIGYMANSKNYNAGLDWEYRSKFCVKADRALWKDKTIYYEGSQFPYTAKELDIDFYDTIDLARDLIHPGIESHKIAAEGIAKNLLELGIK